MNLRTLICSGLLLISTIVSQSLVAQVPTWKVVDSVWSRQFIDIQCADSVNCLAIVRWGDAESQIRRSSDGGQTWNQVYLDTWDFPFYLTPYLTSVAYPGVHCAVVSREGGALLVSYDDCKTWERRQLLIDSSAIVKVCMVDESVGYAVGDRYAVNDRGPLFRTTDGWRTWDDVDLAPHVDSTGAVDLECITADDVKIMTQRTSRNLLATTSDGGATFKTTVIPAGASAVSFINSEHGWFAGSLGTGVGFESRDFIGVTTDGGITWDTLLNDTNPPSRGLQNIVFYDSLHGLASGRNGKILRTVDGGLTWRLELADLDPNGLPHVNAIAYMSRDRAVAAINSGEIVLWEGPVASVASSWGRMESELVRIEPSVVYGDNVWLRYPVASGGPVVVRVHTVDGKEVLSRTIEGEGAVNCRLSTVGLRPGMYFVQVRQGSAVATGRFIVQR